MADSDDEYIQGARSSDDDADLSMTGTGGAAASTSTARAPRRRTAGGSHAAGAMNASGSKRKVTGQARWEASAQNLGLQEGVDGRIEGVLERDIEATKRAR